MADDKGSESIDETRRAGNNDHEKQKHLEAKVDLPVFKNWKKKSLATACLILCFILLGLTTTVFCIAEIIVTIVASVANKLYDAEQSGHMVGMVVLAVTAAITLSITIYGLVGVCRTHTKPLYTTAVVLAIIAIIQALLTGLVVNVSDKDHKVITKALSDSFNFAREGNQRHVRLWASTQSDLQCCGLYGPEDYRGLTNPNFFAPNVPIACCPSYDPKKPDFAQERDREICKAQKTYFVEGCGVPVVEVFTQSSLAVVVVSAMLIVCELLLAIFAGALCKRRKKDNQNSDDPDPET